MPSLEKNIVTCAKPMATKTSRFYFDDSSFFPARIIEIWRPLLKAWLKSSRVWNSDTNGNQDKTTIGANMNSPMIHSYARANSITESQIPSPLKQGLHAWPIFEHEGRKKLQSYRNGYMLSRKTCKTCKYIAVMT